MIDNGSIDMADFTFTEIYPNIARRIDAYLAARSSGPDPIFTDYSSDILAENSGRDVFAFNYKGKSITLTVLIDTQNGVKASKRDYDGPFCGDHAVHIDSAMAMDSGAYLLDLDSAKLIP